MGSGLRRQPVGMSRLALLTLFITAVLGVEGCGGSSSSPPSNPSATSKTTPAQPPTTTSSGSAAPGSLQPEATAAATGDIPDNQVFLTFRSTAGHFSMKYPEGWAQTEHRTTFVFRDKNNIVRIVVGHSGALTPGQAARELGRLKSATVTHAAERITVSGHPAVKVTYKTQSAPNPVTGKRVTLVVDRYYLSSGVRHAVVDLGTPVGVDNVDAYRLMIESFRWS
jgi:hypothetical protein